MNESTPPSSPDDDGLTADEFLVKHGEQISAYVDGELPPAEAAEVERLLADNPEAARLADELREMSGLCQATPEPVFNRDLSEVVVAEALRRQAEGAVELADRLEPEGDFGLPFGKSSRSWMWAVFAAAAAVMIGFYGRPAPPTGGPAIARATPQQIQESLVAMQRAVPGMQVRRFQATPNQLVQLQRVLAQQSVQPTQAPSALMAVSKNSGVQVEPFGPTIVSTDASDDEPTEELICVDADEAELDRLLGGLDGEVVRVESDRETPAPAPQVATASQAAPAPAPGIRGVWRVRLSPEAAAQLIAQQQAMNPTPGQRRLVILRIQVKPAGR